MDINYLKKRKKELHLTNKQLAEQSGVSLGTVNKIMSGAIKSPRYDTMQAIWDVLLLRQDGIVGERYKEAEEFALQVSEEAVVSHDLAEKQGLFTIDDYYHLPKEQRVELINGVFYDMGAPTIRHQSLIAEIAFVIQSYIRLHKGKCRVLFSPVDVWLDQDEYTMVQPDLLIICDEKKSNGRRINGAPDWVMEVTSPGTQYRDFLLKLNKYMNAGVKEYWIVDTGNDRVLVYHNMNGDFGVETYTFADRVPVGIYPDLTVDFQELDLME